MGRADGDEEVVGHRRGTSMDRGWRRMAGRGQKVKSRGYRSGRGRPMEGEEYELRPRVGS